MASAESTSPLIVRLDSESKRILSQAAELRRISVSDYLRQMTVSQARKEFDAASKQIISLIPDEQLAFWNALHRPAKLTEAQKKRGKFMRGQA